MQLKSLPSYFFPPSVLPFSFLPSFLLPSSHCFFLPLILHFFSLSYLSSFYYTLLCLSLYCPPRSLLIPHTNTLTHTHASASPLSLFFLWTEVVLHQHIIRLIYLLLISFYHFFNPLFLF